MSTCRSAPTSRLLRAADVSLCVARNITFSLPRHSFSSLAALTQNASSSSVLVSNDDDGTPIRRSLSESSGDVDVASGERHMLCPQEQSPPRLPPRKKKKKNLRLPTERRSSMPSNDRCVAVCDAFVLVSQSIPTLSHARSMLPPFLDTSLFHKNNFLFAGLTKRDIFLWYALSLVLPS